MLKLCPQADLLLEFVATLPPSSALTWATAGVLRKDFGVNEVGIYRHIEEAKRLHGIRIIARNNSGRSYAIHKDDWPKASRLCDDYWSDRYHNFPV